MRNTLSRFAAIALCSAVAGFTFTGCEKLDSDNHKSENEVAKKIADGRAKLELAQMKRQEAEALPKIAVAAEGGMKWPEKIPAAAHSIEGAERLAQADLAEAKKLLDESAALLKAAASSSAVDKDTQAFAKAIYAEQRYEQALDLLQEMQKPEAQARQMIIDLHGLASRIAANKQQSDAYGLQDPTKVPPKADAAAAADEKEKGVLDAITAKQEEKKKGKEDLAAKTAELQKQFDELKAKSDAITIEKTAADTQMADLAKQAEAARNILPGTNAAEIARIIAEKQKSLQFTKQSLDAREKSQNLGNQIDTLAAQMAELQRGIDGNKQLAALSDASIEMLNKQAEAVKATWAKVQEQQQTLTTDSEGVVTGGATAATTQPAPSVAGTSKKLAETLKDLEDKRTRVIALLDEAKKYYLDAKTAAIASKTDYQKRFLAVEKTTPPSAQAVLFTEMKELNREEPYRLSRGRVFNTAGYVYAMQASLLGDVAGFVHQLQAIDPKLVNEDLAKIDASLKESQEHADDQYKVANPSGEATADNDLKAVVDAKLTPLSEGASAAQLFAMYGRYNVLNVSRFLAKEDVATAKRSGDDAKVKEAEATAATAESAALDSLKVASNAYKALEDNVKKLFDAPEDLQTGTLVAFNQATADDVKALSSAAKTSTTGPSTQPAPVADTPDIAQARTIALQFVEALTKNDPTTAQTRTNLPADQNMFIEPLANETASIKKMTDAANEKYTPEKPVPASLDRFKEIKAGTGKASTDGVTFGGLVITKDADGAWKITNLGTNIPAVATLQANAMAYDQLATAVTSGTYATAKEFTDALAKVTGGAATTTTPPEVPATPATPTPPADPATPTTPADPAAPKTPTTPTPK